VLIHHNFNEEGESSPDILACLTFCWLLRRQLNMSVMFSARCSSQVAFGMTATPRCMLYFSSTCKDITYQDISSSQHQYCQPCLKQHCQAAMKCSSRCRNFQRSQPPQSHLCHCFACFCCNRRHHWIALELPAIKLSTQACVSHTHNTFAV